VVALDDFWMFDRQTVTFTHFDGNGHVLDHEITKHPAIVSACLTAFETAWELAIPHNEFKPA
jgi:hypothetical protein